jgi:hypothetical protein
MSQLIQELDNLSSIKIGENGHAENIWSKDNREKIVQFSFQLTRTNQSQIENLEIVFRNLLTDINYHYESKKIIAPIYEELIITLYKLIAQTRDIFDGKGEYSLSYMMLYVWFDFFPDSARYMLSRFVEDPNDKHPYGSWKDIKYFADMCYLRDETHPLISYSIQLLNTQLKDDYDKIVYGNQDISLVAKWIPREKSKFGWLFEKLAEDYYQEFMPVKGTFNPTISSHVKGLLKCKTHYRKLLSKLNKVLDTVQIKQCSNQWESIQPSKQTAITMKRQNKAFFNIDKKGNQRSSNEDRIICSQHFKEYINKATRGEVQIKGKRLGMNEFVKEAIELSHSLPAENTELIELLNAQWKNNSSSTLVLEKMIPMVDVSGSMDGDPLNAAIGLGLRVAEKSLIGKRIMTFSASPSWVNLEGIDSFVHMVAKVKQADWGMNTNFYAALDLILTAIVNMKMSAEDVEDMTLAIFSDMQIDRADSSYKDMFSIIRTKYANAGIAVCGKPYSLPHILFWNLRSTNGFPTLSNQQNTSMMSGYSPALLNLFCEDGKESFRNPWTMLMYSLSNKRYSDVEEFMISQF